MGKAKINILIIGGGGREHALVWKISQSARVDKIFVTPGNAGTSKIAKNVDIEITNLPKLVQFAKENKIA